MHIQLFKHIALIQVVRIRGTLWLVEDEMVAIAVVVDHELDEVTSPRPLIIRDFTAVAIATHQIGQRRVVLLLGALWGFAGLLPRLLTPVQIAGIAAEHFLAPAVAIVGSATDEVPCAVALCVWDDPVIRPVG